MINVTRKVHQKDNFGSTTDVNLSELDQDDGSEKGYRSDPGFISNLVLKARRLSRSISKSKKIPHALPSEFPADVPVPVITVDTPKLTRAIIARVSETAQLLQPEGSIPPPPQPPISDPTASHSMDRPSPLMTSALRYDIFLADAPKPTLKATVPTDPQAVIVSTLQLVLCARLLLDDHHPSTSQSSPTEVDVLDDA
ncbi:hypothetical protein BGZ88_005341, partial [Linnemannia elongata]